MTTTDGARLAAHLGTRSATELARAVASREISPVEIVEDVLGAIDGVQARLHPFLAADPDLARERAREAERAVMSGSALGPLHGVPVVVKDLEMTVDLPSSSGAGSMRDHRPDADSVLVERLRSAGAVIVAKTNTPAFGLLGETRNSLGPATGNPWHPGLTAGGSSGGSAAAVVAGVVPVGTGTDSAGSINCPASMCGAFGIKPSHGRVPMVPNAGDSLLFNDGGPLTRSVADAALALHALAGHDRRDPVALRGPVPDFVGALGKDVGGLRVAASEDLGHFAVDPEVRAIVRNGFARASALVARLDERTPRIPDPWSIYTPLYVTDMRVSLGEYVQQHPDDVYPDTFEELSSVPPLSAEDYVRHSHALLRFRSVLADFFEDVDLLLTPATAVAAFPHSAPPEEIGGRRVPRGWTGFMPFEITWNMTGQPAASIPVGFTSDGRPVGMLAVAPLGREDLLFAFASAYERAHPWPLIVPSD